LSGLLVLPSVVILAVLTVAVAATLLAPRLVPRQLNLDIAPDCPLPFGSEMSWLAVKTEDAEGLARALGLTDLRAANWNSGIGAIYDEELSDSVVFVSPPVKGWTIVAGVPLPLPAGGAFIDKTTPLLRQLSQRFASVQYFASFPIIDFYAWARFERGRRIRAFAVGDTGVVWDTGRLTPGERRLGLSLIELRGIRERHGDIGGELDLHPTEQYVLSVAAAWSFSPFEIASYGTGPGVGWIGRAPHAWRTDRLRSVA
jgi:hypothetical protein